MNDPIRLSRRRFLAGASGATLRRRAHCSFDSVTVFIASISSTCDGDNWNTVCGEVILPHRACPHCGHYAGREVVEVKESG